MKKMELINKRKKNEKHYLNEDGTIVAEIYDNDIHYLKDGKYEEIDNTLVKDKNCYINISNDYKVYFSEDNEKFLMKIENKNNYLIFNLNNSLVSKAKRKSEKSKLFSSVIYKNILNHIDIQYDIHPSKLKETIILHERDISDIIFSIDTNLKLVLNNNDIVAMDENSIVYTIETPYMIDANNNVNNNIYYEILNENDKYEIKLILDKEWLNSNDRVFPVQIDPSIINNGQDSGIYDTYIYPGDNGVNRGNQDILKAGVEKVNGVNRINRTLIKFDLPTIGTGSEIINANLYLTGYIKNSTDNNNPYQTIEIHQITEQWNEDTATWDQMNNKYAEKVSGLQFIKRSVVSGSEIYPSYSEYNDITDLVKKWYRDTPNYGIMIKAVREEYINENYPAFFSKNNSVQGYNPQPVLSITYRNQSGLEEYMNYINQSFVDGSTFVNTYNGNLVGMFSVGSTIGGKMPIHLSLVYNTNDVILKNDGFKFNMIQTLKDYSASEQGYIEYEDGDGTTHYFYKDNDSNDNKYFDEDGLNLNITKENNTFYMVDKFGNKKVFIQSSGVYYLSMIEDVKGNVIQTIFDSNNKISKLIDANGSEINITYSNNMITVSSPDRTTTINYSDGKVNSITTINGITTFTYNSNKLITSILDVNGMKINYEYYSQSPYRIKKVTQYGLNNSQGEYFSVEYGFNSTTIIDNKDRSRTLIFNSCGNLLSSNSMESEEDIRNAYSIASTYGNDEYKKNKLLSDTIPVRYSKNYISDSSFENNSNIFSTSNTDLVSISVSNACSRTGFKSLLIDVDNHGIGLPIVSTPFTIKPGQNYTFSGYFKCYDDYTLQLVGQDGNCSDLCVIEASDDFVRYEVTLYAQNNTDNTLYIKLVPLGPGPSYIDDIQLEDGEAASNYNIVENSDFSNGIGDWTFSAYMFDYSVIDEYGGATQVNLPTSNIFSLANINNNMDKALKVSMNPLGISKFEKTFNIKGTEGDIYDISFWVKNDGLVGNINGDGTQGGSQQPQVGNYVMIYFKPIGHEAEYCILSSKDFTPNEKWQYYTYRCSAPEDYESIKLIFTQVYQANDMYITNMTFYKDLNTCNYDFDDNGNIISSSDSLGRTNTFNYNKNNQLISATTAIGNRFKYEYDSIKNDLTIDAVSSSGISNRVKYDNNYNPISTIISKKYKDELTTGNYKIRSKGTDKYLKAEYFTALMESNDCSNTVWNLEKIENQFKIIYSVVPSYSLMHSNNNLTLSNVNNNNLFMFEKNNDGSYHIKNTSNNKYLKANGNLIEFSDLISTDPAFDFYVELITDKFIENDAIYTDDGKFISSVTDSLLNTTEYTINNTNGLITSTTNANDQKIDYNYNSKRQISSITQGNKTINYNYNSQNLLSQIIDGSKQYNFTYDNFLNIKKVMIGNNITLVTNSYEPNNGNLLSTTYGNNQVISYDYDHFNRVSIIHKMDNDYKYIYDSNGNLAKILSNNSISTFDASPMVSNTLYKSFKYDLVKRINEYTNYDFKINYSYDSDDNIINQIYKYKTGDIKFFSNINSTYSHGTLTNELIDYTKSTYIPMYNDYDITSRQSSIDYQYDDLERLVIKSINNQYSTSYEYMSNGNRT